MIHLTTTAGLDTFAPDADETARLLGEHLAAVAGTGLVRWTITGPAGHLHVGQITIDPDGPAADDFLADTVEEIPPERNHDAAATSPNGPHLRVVRVGVPCDDESAGPRSADPPLMCKASNATRARCTRS